MATYTYKCFVKCDDNEKHIKELGKRTYIDFITNTQATAERPSFCQLLRTLQKGDTVRIYNLYSLGYTIDDIINTYELLQSKDIIIEFKNNASYITKDMAVNCTNMAELLSAMQILREVIRAKRKEDKKIIWQHNKAKGKKKNAISKVNIEKYDRFVQLYEVELKAEGKVNISKLARLLDITRVTASKWVVKHKLESKQ